MKNLKVIDWIMIAYSVALLILSFIIKFRGEVNIVLIVLGISTLSTTLIQNKLFRIIVVGVGVAILSYIFWIA
jgi:hypothetical protein